MEGTSSSNTVNGKRKKSDKTRRLWTLKEEEVLVNALKQMVATGQWKSENGFRCGYLVHLEEAMRKVFPNTDLRSMPHINSKVHVWKKTHGTLVTMLSRSGIGWNDTEKTIDATNEAWECFVKSDSSAHTMRYKSWPYYHDWCEIFGNDRATGDRAETFAAAVQGVFNMSNDVDPYMEIGLDDIFRVVEEGDESVSATNPTIGPCNKQPQSKKRKSQPDGEDHFVTAINSFTDMARDSISELVKNMRKGNDTNNVTKDVFDALGKIPDLSKSERMLAAELLLEKPNKLSLFLVIPEDERLEFVKKLLI